MRGPRQGLACRRSLRTVSVPVPGPECNFLHVMWVWDWLLEKGKLGRPEEGLQCL